MVDKKEVKELTKEQLESKGRMVSAMEEITAIQKKYEVSFTLVAIDEKDGVKVKLNLIDIRKPETAETVADKIK